MEPSASVLDPSERGRAAEFLDPVAGRRYVQARTALRRLLGGYLGLDAAEVPICLDAGGKPQLSPPYSGLGFNLSHAEHLCLFAFVQGHAVGTDLESIQELPGLTLVAGRFFSPAEQAALRELPPSQFTAAFYRTWVRREAALKALGLGLKAAADDISVSVGAASGPSGLWPLKAGSVAQTSWLTCDLQVTPGFCAALAIPGGAGLRVCVHPDSGLPVTARPE